MIEAASGGQIILGIFTAAATTLDVKSEELLYGRKLTFKEKYLGTMDQMKGAIVFFVYFGIILLIFMFIPEPLNEILAEVLGGIGAVVGAIYFYLKGGRKFPDVLIISDHDCVILKGIHWNKNDQLHRFEDGVKIIRNHATIKTHGFTKVIEIIVYSAEKGLFGNQKKDVTVTLRQSSRSLKKGRKELGDQLLEFQQAKEILDRLPKSVWHPS